MRRNTGNGIKAVVIGIILIGLIAGYYYYLSNKKQAAKEEPVELTAVQEVLMYNFERNYPPSPKETVKMFGQITQCLYNETYTDEEFQQLAVQIEKLYDEELIANKTKEQYLEDLRLDVERMKAQEIVISSYATSSSTDVDYFSKDGYECARLYCSFTMRRGTELVGNSQLFVLRKDDDGHWKIYGWKPVQPTDEEEEAQQETEAVS